ncbi:cytoplasmic protein [Pseudomonas aeruginosa]|nr:cytoplasmic protein [Pseudomonas aeruginosa]
MQGRLVFLLEEPSMKSLLDALLPRLFPGWESGMHFLCVPHQGKSDLDLSIPRKLSAWRIPGDRFVIVRDNDNADCAQIKARLLKVCAQNGRPDTLVRLVCQELEGWYLGDLGALSAAYDDARLDTPALRKRYSVPDDWQKPSVELERLVPSFQKGSGARRMGRWLGDERSNRSRSYQVFLEGVMRLATEMGWAPVAE